MTHAIPHKQAILPNFLICGAPKAGTSSLHVWIADHPDALGSTEKETYFCVDPDTHMYRSDASILNGLDGYSRYFQPSPGKTPKVVIESTPAYIYYETALRHVPDLPTSPKCLFVLREPAQQIYSLFTYFQTNWSWIPSDMSFDAYLKILRRGAGKEQFRGNELASDALINARYADFLLRWRDRLGPERMMVRSFDTLKNEPKRLTQEVAAWIGLDPAFYDTYDFPRDNETYAVRNNALQRINVSIRSALPRGAVYHALRSLYRRINTQSPTGPSSSDKDLIAELSQEYVKANQTLLIEFGLDISDWSGSNINQLRR